LLLFSPSVPRQEDLKIYADKVNEAVRDKNEEDQGVQCTIKEVDEARGVRG
jgi:hypothetical protein